MSVRRRAEEAAAALAAPREALPLRARRSLRARLEEAEQTLAAIRKGEVDAVVVGGPAGERVFTLEGAERGYRVLMEAMSEGVATVSELGVVTYCNARFAEIVGAPLERTLGSSISALVLQADRASFHELMAAADTGRSERELWLQAPESSAPALARLAVVALAIDGARTHCLVVTDLTEQRRQSAAIAAERLQMQTRLLLADRMSSLGTLAAGVAHEINNPLASVLTSLELVSARLLDPARQELAEQLGRPLERARHGVERVQLIVRGLKGFSRADDESMGLVDPRRTLDASLALLSSEIRPRARLVADYDALPVIWANEVRLEQVLVNLLVNATQAIAAGAVEQNEIRVTGRTDDQGRALIEIRDTGTGIQPADLALVFDPFFTTRPLNTGTGLGLALCHAIVTSLGGQISVTSEVGVGSVFRVAVPGAQGKAPAPPARAEVSTPCSPPRRRMLFIDDEVDLCEAVEAALATAHDVVTTTDARQALALFAAGEAFDLILCDLRMPQMTGIDFYALLAVEHPAQAARVVLMSGGYYRKRDEPPLTVPRPLLEKPFVIAQLMSLMQQAPPRDAARAP